MLYNKLDKKWEFRNYNLPVKYTKKSFGQSFVDHLGLTIFNSMPYEFKKNVIMGDTINIKYVVYNFYFWN